MNKPWIKSIDDKGLDFDPFNDKQLLQAYCEANEQDFLEFVDKFMEAYNEAHEEREEVEDR